MIMAVLSGWASRLSQRVRLPPRREVLAVDGKRKSLRLGSSGYHGRGATKTPCRRERFRAGRCLLQRSEAMPNTMPAAVRSPGHDFNDRNDMRNDMKNWFKENRGFFVFLACFGFFRTAIADWNPIPSGSMRPNLLEGDVVLVDRLAYDFKLPLTDIAVAHIGEPRRGEIVTFSSPRDGTRLIKRIVALPGDVVQMRDDALFVNGKVADYSEPEVLTEPSEFGGRVRAVRLTETIGTDKRRVQLLEGVPARRTFGPLTVPADSYLMLGDNRDNSADSRYIGFVPRRLLIGQALRILVSADIKGNWAPRLDRFGQRLQ
jgi:signal peptidase I